MAQAQTSAAGMGAHDEAGKGAQARARGPLVTFSLQVLMLVAVLVAMIPGIFMIMTSLKTNTQYGIDKLGLPAPITSENFQTVLTQHPFPVWMLNSALLSGGAVLVTSAVSVLAAYAIARMNFVGRELLLGISTSMMAVPPVVMVVPLFVLFAQIDLVGTLHGVILIYAGLLTPFSVFLLVTFFRTIPTELIESALIDGASPLGVLIRIILPLSGAPLVTLFVVNLLYVWNDLLIALLFLPDEKLRTLMVGISVFQGRYLQDIPLSMAGMTLASLPMILIYIVFQRYFIRGLVAGAVKG
ncbi:MAG: carbohydrate ABC transporter permease [Chloroflexi bacterium]|nr:carbohydrate ABC transporter permease [Chloroflexota bacterium]